VDLALLAAAVIGLPFAFMPLGAANRIGMPERSSRLGLLLLLALQAGFTIVAAGIVSSVTRDNDSEPWLRELGRAEAFPWIASAVIGGVAALFAALVAGGARFKLAMVLLAAVVSVSASATRWSERLVNFEVYDEQEASGKYDVVYTLVPFSPAYGRSDIYTLPPMTRIGSQKTVTQFWVRHVEPVLGLAPERLN
jgi:hypothetical protein